MAAPAAAVDTAAPPPPPPPPSTEPAATAIQDQKVAHPPAPVPQPDAAPAQAPRKGKLEEAGFHNSDYYKIRAVVADLRLRFVQVSQATDFRNCDAAREILKEMMVVMELSKKMRLNLAAVSVPAKLSEKLPAVPVKDQPMKPSEKPSAGHVKDDSVKPSEVPLAGPVKEEPMKPSEEPSAGPVKEEPRKSSEEPSAGPMKDEPMKPSEEPSVGLVKDEIAVPIPPEENNQVPQVGQTVLPPGNESVDAPTKHSESTAVQMEE